MLMTGITVHIMSAGRPTAPPTIVTCPDPPVHMEQYNHVQTGVGIPPPENSRLKHLPWLPLASNGILQLAAGTDAES